MDKSPLNEGFIFTVSNNFEGLYAIDTSIEFYAMRTRKLVDSLLVKDSHQEMRIWF